MRGREQTAADDRRPGAAPPIPLDHRGIENQMYLGRVYLQRMLVRTSTVEVLVPPRDPAIIIYARTLPSREQAGRVTSCV
jgi:hypothetical protein